MSTQPYSLAQRTSSGTTAEAAWELIAGASKSVYVRQIGVTIAAATASTFGLGRPAAKGITPTSPVTCKSMRTAAGVAGAAGALAWATKPTIPAEFLRRIGLPATIGVGIVWDFHQGLIIPAGASLVLWNLASNSVADVWVAIDE